jgi:hypothetical protein
VVAVSFVCVFLVAHGTVSFAVNVSATYSAIADFFTNLDIFLSTALLGLLSVADMFDSQGQLPTSFRNFPCSLRVFLSAGRINMSSYRRVRSASFSALEVLSSLICIALLFDMVFNALLLPQISDGTYIALSTPLMTSVIVAFEMSVRAKLKPVLNTVPMDDLILACEVFYQLRVHSFFTSIFPVQQWKYYFCYVVDFIRVNCPCVVMVLFTISQSNCVSVEVSF